MKTNQRTELQAALRGAVVYSRPEDELQAVLRGAVVYSRPEDELQAVVRAGLRMSCRLH